MRVNGKVEAADEPAVKQEVKKELAVLAVKQEKVEVKKEPAVLGPGEQHAG